MTTIGQIEKKTQARVVRLFRETLDYAYLGDWTDRPGNANIEPELLRAWLQRQDGWRTNAFKLKRVRLAIREALQSWARPATGAVDTGAIGTGEAADGSAPYTVPNDETALEALVDRSTPGGFGSTWNWPGSPFDASSTSLFTSWHICAYDTTVRPSSHLWTGSSPPGAPAGPS